MYATAIGSGKTEVESFFEKEYKENMTFDEVINLTLNALRKVGDKAISKDTIDIVYITEKDRKFTVLEKERLDKYIKSLGSASKKTKEE